MKKLIAILVIMTVVFASTLPIYAMDGKVTYSGNAGKCIFEPGSDYSLTDLFPEFKGVMPGDSLTQKITVKNNADNKVKVKIYIRALGAHEDSVEFLSKLKLKVSKSEENNMAYMFDAAASETAQLTDWVYLGTLYSGGIVNLDATLDVPVELDNNYKNKIGYLDWEFMIEELPVESTDPKPPFTGDSTNMTLWVVLISSIVLMFVLILILKKRNKEQEEND